MYYSYLSLNEVRLFQGHYDSRWAGLRSEALPQVAYG